LASGFGLPALDSFEDPQIGQWGTIGRLIVGGLLVGGVVIGHTCSFHLLPWLVGLLVFPAGTLMWQRIHVWRTPGRLQATGPVAHLLNVGVFLALYLTPYYAPAITFTSDAALLFYGASMLLAAVRGYAGCEILAISNTALRRNDQIGCLLFGPIDQLEHSRSPAGVEPDNHPSTVDIGGR
jgi:hypothetical protein